MLAKGHIATGAAGFLGIVAPIAVSEGMSFTPGELVAGTAVAAGSALLPDLDHPKATLSRSLGPITGVAARIIAKLAGGHRQGTHSLLALAGVAIGAHLLLAGLSTLLVPFIITSICLALVVRVAFERVGEALGAVMAMAGAAVLLAVCSDFSWMALAIAAGYALHLAGDALTAEGVPLLWPISKRRFGIGFFKTGSKMETVVTWCAIGAVGVLAWSSVLAPAIAQTHGL